MVSDAALMQLCFCSLTGISYVAPHLNNLYFLTLCQRFGVYQVIRWLFMLKLGLSVVMLLAGADHVSLLCIFIARYGCHLIVDVLRAFAFFNLFNFALLGWFLMFSKLHTQGKRDL